MCWPPCGMLKFAVSGKQASPTATRGVSFSSSSSSFDSSRFVDFPPPLIGSPSSHVVTPLPFHYPHPYPAFFTFATHLRRCSPRFDWTIKRATFLTSPRPSSFLFLYFFFSKENVLSFHHPSKHRTVELSDSTRYLRSSWKLI